MTESRKISIKRLAINSLELLSSEPKVSDALFPLETSSGIIDDFFQTHILDTRELTKAQFEHFISEISLIQKDEVEIIREKYLINPYAELNNTLFKLLMLLLIINLVMILFFFVFICVKYNYCLC